mgnify:FL=1|jgi:hypothetical protein
MGVAGKLGAKEVTLLCGQIPGQVPTQTQKIAIEQTELILDILHKNFETIGPA